MSETTYAGLDYGNGLANVDKDTGIRFGVLPVNEICQVWYDGSEAVWAEDAGDFDEALGEKYEKDGYKVHHETDSADVWVTKSPYYTLAQFCSPCAPGAGYLLNPCKDGPKTYCFHHDWFESGEAPYPVFRVETGKLIQVARVLVPCVNCAGTGKDNITRVANVRGCSTADIAEEIVTGKFPQIPASTYDSATGSFQCWRCNGVGKLPEIQYPEIG